MTRETKAQREVRETAEREARVTVAKATYVERMMSMLARATKMNFELEVNSALSFVLTDRDDRRASTYHVRPEWDDAFADMQLYELEMAVEFKEEEAAERERVANLRATALAKLTQEERTLLNV